MANVSSRRARGDSPAGGDDVEDDSKDMDVGSADANMGAPTNTGHETALFADRAGRTQNRTYIHAYCSCIVPR